MPRRIPRLGFGVLMRKTKSKLIWLILMFFVMAVIFWFSNQNGSASVGISNSISKWLYVHLGGLWKESSSAPVIFGLSLRKLAHVLGYAILAITAIGLSKSWWIATLICTAYACLDEVHQYFISGRNATPRDVLVDAMGFGVVIAVWMIMNKRIECIDSSANPEH